MPRDMKGPQLAALEAAAKRMADVLDDALQGSAAKHELGRIGFTLFLFTLEPGWLTYVANCERSDMILNIQDWLARHGETVNEPAQMLIGLEERRWSLMPWKNRDGSREWHVVKHVHDDGDLPVLCVGIGQNPLAAWRDALEWEKSA